MYNFFHIIKIHYLGLSFLGHPQNYKYYNITFVIFHNVIIKYSVVQILHILPLQSCKYSVIQILPIFPLQSCTKWSSKYCIFFPYKVVQYLAIRILPIFPLQSCTKWSSKYCIFFPYKVVQYSVIQILHIFPLQSCTIFGHPNISSIFCLLNEVNYTCYQQHINILFVCYFVNSFIFALIMHREY